MLADFSRVFHPLYSSQPEGVLQIFSETTRTRSCKKIYWTGMNGRAIGRIDVLLASKYSSWIKRNEPCSLSGFCNLSERGRCHFLEDKEVDSGTIFCKTDFAMLLEIRSITIRSTRKFHSLRSLNFACASSVRFFRARTLPLISDWIRMDSANTFWINAIAAWNGEHFFLLDQNGLCQHVLLDQNGLCYVSCTKNLTTRSRRHSRWRGLCRQEDLRRLCACA